MQQHTLFWCEDLILNLAPGQNNQPLPLAFDEDAEELSFPAIYYGVKRRFTCRATQFMIASSEIRRRDRRGVKSDHILYMAAKVLRLRIIANVNLAFRANNDQINSVSRRDLEDTEFVKSLLLKNEAFMRNIQNSIQ